MAIFMDLMAGVQVITSGWIPIHGRNAKKKLTDKRQIVDVHQGKYTFFPQMQNSRQCPLVGWILNEQRLHHLRFNEIRLGTLTHLRLVEIHWRWTLSLI